MACSCMLPIRSTHPAAPAPPAPAASGTCSGAQDKVGEFWPCFAWQMKVDMRPRTRGQVAKCMCRSTSSCMPAYLGHHHILSHVCSSTHIILHGGVISILHHHLRPLRSLSCRCCACTCGPLRCCASWAARCAGSNCSSSCCSATSGSGGAGGGGSCRRGSCCVLLLCGKRMRPDIGE